MPRRIHFRTAGTTEAEGIVNFRRLLADLTAPYERGDLVGVKVHWGEAGNRGFLPPLYTAAVVSWLRDQGVRPYVFDTTVLYSGGRRDGRESLKTAASHGFTEASLGCPLVIADGFDGRDTVEIDASMNHFETVQVASVTENTDGFFILSHFTGHMGSGFGAAIKNISMGFASRAQKQRMHADARPELKEKRCTRCGVCVDCCPVGAATIIGDRYPDFNLERCIGCAQCIALCPEAALKLFWNCEPARFQERLVETAAAVWRRIGRRSLCVNALVRMTVECDCLPGDNPGMAADIGFVGGHHPVTVDRESVERVGASLIDSAHPGVPWRRQFEYADRLGFCETGREEP